MRKILEKIDVNLILEKKVKTCVILISSTLEMILQPTTSQKNEKNIWKKIKFLQTIFQIEILKMTEKILKRKLK
jgi:hypothetical protein